MRSIAPLLLFGLLAVGSVFADSFVFVTSATYGGNLGGISGANSKCQQLASNAGLPGTYFAWLSTEFPNTSDPRARFIRSNSAYKLTNGTVIANNWSDLVDGTLLAPIDRTESAAGPISSNVWTATLQDATAVPGYTCNDWSSATAPNGGIGFSGSSTATWTAFDGTQCFQQARLYCFQQVPNLVTISGRVLSSNGRAITNARIVVSGGGLPEPLIYYTNRRGEYSTAPLQGRKSYNLTVSQPRFAFSPSGLPVSPSDDNVVNVNFTGTM